ncbi:histidine phosphatase family protein [Chengkuizengella sediminis]|uniref:histidine phosphatase family protein n=1 Tax=Chengkuizengella sediminis TaxID=1885917 RepID=UPI001389A462|nr:histidine phosphatase family protein [Chengkuizengella sediminis]NDI34370.1 histidine phosphatase family protein [Chengkuizengella sediminis]
MTIIGLVRHGVTDWNQKHIIQGHRDISLNEEGKEQAAALGNRLVDSQWDIILSSDLSRAKETASIIAKRLNLVVSSYDERLRERYLGALEGLSYEDRIQKYGDDWHAIHQNLELEIEEDEQLKNRGLEVIEDVQKLYRNKRVLIVSHGGLINQLLRELLAEFDSKIQNTSITILEKERHQWKSILLNCTEHL